MALMPVNDPELLKQLGAPTEDATPVSDPDLLRQLNGDTSPEDPGLLKSAAAGVMSGVPLAESATAGVQSLVHNTPYAKEHDALEALKDAAWDKHPYAYGAGKTAGIVGTGAIAPAGIPGAIGIGAASGLDQATQLSDVPGDVLKGAAVGGVMGTLGEKVISPLISKIPGAAKSVLSTFGKDTTREGVDSYLANPDLINQAPGSVAQAEVLQTVANQLRGRVKDLSDKAMSKLSPNSYTTLEEIAPMFDGIKQGLTTEGEAGPAQQAAINAISGWQSMLTKISGEAPESVVKKGLLDASGKELTDTIAATKGKIPETVLGQIIRDIDENTNWADQSAATTNNALKELRHSLDVALKESNPDYAEAMKPVSETAKLLSGIKKNFGLKYEPNEGLASTDTTNSKMANVLNENKSNAQDVLKQAGKTAGVDFLDNAKNAKIQKSFESGSGGGLRTVLSGLGMGAGAMVGHPWIGGTVTGALSTQLDGGQIAKSILDMYISGSKKMADAGVTKALQTFGPMLANAAKAGGNQLAATHFVLATSNPEYQTLINHAQNNNQ